MTNTIIFDIETTGLDWKDPNFRVHCISCYSLLTKKMITFSGCQLLEGVEYLNHADIIVGHYIQFYDIPVLEYVFKTKLTAKPFDTKVLGTLMFPDTKGHHLADWGKRLGVLKNNFDYKQDLSILTVETIALCEQDVLVAKALYEYLLSQNWSQESIDLETEVATAVQKLVSRGVEFDEKAALSLSQELMFMKDGLRLSLEASTPKDFNPASPKQVYELLISKYGWNPTELTPTGKPKIDEGILSTLDYEEAILISKFRAVNKLLGVLVNGEDSWISHVKSGRIYGRINTCGTVTGRMSHFQPNLGNVSNVNSFKGKECRELFIAPPGRVLLGCDAKAIQPRAIAHLLQPYDKGKMIGTILSGDIHTENAKYIFNTDNPTPQQRSKGKELYLAKCFRAGIKRFMEIMGCNFSEAKRLWGHMSEMFPELEQLVNDIERDSKVGHLIGLDGRRIPVRMVIRSTWQGEIMQPKAAFNAIVQNIEAVVMKKALCLMEKYDTIKPVLWGHDEIVAECNKEHAEEAREIMLSSLKFAGEFYNLKCPIEGEAKIGINWYEVH